MTHVSNNSGNNEWYTPSKYIESARIVMGSIDTDPASNDIAQQTVRASKYYTIDTDGLSQSFCGNVWMNPPYAGKLIRDFVSKLGFECAIGNCSQFVTMTNNATDTAWFATLMAYSDVICLPVGRIKFLSPSGELGNSPLQGQCFCYRGPNVQKFTDEFKKYGNILKVTK